MNEELIQHILKEHECILADNTRRIVQIENKQAETNIRIDNLCKSIDDLTSTIKWLIALCITTLLGFAIWVMQNSIFK